MGRVGWTLAAAAMMSLAASRAGADSISSPLFNITDLGTLTETYGIGSNGQVVGTASGKAYVYGQDAAKPQLQTLTGLGTGYSLAHAINDSGQIVGSLPVPGPLATLEHAFVQTGGATTDLGTLGGRFSGALGINNNGQIAGTSETAGGQTHGFIFSGGKMTDVGTLGGTNSDARVINDSGQVAGAAQTADGSYHAFLTTLGGTMKDLGTLGGGSSYTYGINNAGQVVGFSQGTDGKARAFIYNNTTGGPMQDLNAPGINNVASAINSSGQVVGWSFGNNASASDYRAWYFDGTTMKDLTSLLPANSGWQSLNGTTGINDAGQITGWGTGADGLRHAFVLTPTGPGQPGAVPEPTTLAMLGLASLGYGAHRLRRRPAAQG
jgi:probable HAF family extracellular repeat protein